MTRIELPTLTLREIARRLDITLMAISLWREGSEQREPLPVIITNRGGANRVSIVETELMKWLGEYRPDLLARWVSTSGQGVMGHGGVGGHA